MDATSYELARLLPYVPVILLALFLNFADIYFLQSEPLPPLHRSFSFWLYLTGHIIVALLAAFFLYEKAGVNPSDWPVVAVASAFAGFSILQSFTVKFGDKGIDARDLFDSWKRRVIEDVSKSNTSKKRARQMKVARDLARKAATTPQLLELAIHQLAPSVQLDPKDVIADAQKSGQDPALIMAQWIASVDLEYAENLLRANA